MLRLLHYDEYVLLRRYGYLGPGRLKQPPVSRRAALRPERELRTARPERPQLPRADRAPGRLAR
jgi:hypothetical protein